VLVLFACITGKKNDYCHEKNEKNQDFLPRTTRTRRTKKIPFGFVRVVCVVRGKNSSFPFPNYGK
jgi:hypothetical protein